MLRVFVFAFSIFSLAGCSLLLTPTEEEEDAGQVEETFPQGQETCLARCSTNFCETVEGWATCLETVALEAGVFLQGATEEGSFLDGANDERPSREVSSTPLLVGKYEVSAQLFQLFLKDINIINARNYVDGGVGDLALCNVSIAGITSDLNGNGGLPANCVTHAGAEAFCSWAGMSLPTEAQWDRISRTLCDEDGCDPTLTAEYSWGPTYDSERVNADLALVTVVSGQAQTNEGVHHVTGNVAEWTRDTYDQCAYRRTDSFTTQQFDTNGCEQDISPCSCDGARDGLVVVRGSASLAVTDPNKSLDPPEWFEQNNPSANENRLRSSNRDGRDPDRGYTDVGFRCVRAITGAQ